MKLAEAGATGESLAQATDARLVRKCLDGEERAWSALIARYKRLIYSIPFKYGAPGEVAEEIFQAVCLDLVTELPRLRRPEAVKAWLLSICRHKSLRWKERTRRESAVGGAELMEELPDSEPGTVQLIEEAEREQAVRTAVARLPPRCRKLVEMLFFSQPPPPYAEVAARLGLATGSIGFIRGRCLKKLEAGLKTEGF